MLRLPMALHIGSSIIPRSIRKRDTSERSSYSEDFHERFTNKQLTKKDREGEREEWKRLEELCAAKMLRIIYQFSLGGAKASAYSVGSDSRVFSSRQYNTCARPVSRSTPLPFRVYQNVSNA